MKAGDLANQGFWGLIDYFGIDPVGLALSATVLVIVIPFATQWIVSQFAQKEIAKFTSELSADLERLKARLSNEAEMRKLVAQKRLELLLDLFAAMEPIVRDAVNTKPSDYVPVIESTNKLIARMRACSVLFTKETVDAMNKYGPLMVKAKSMLDAGDEAALDFAMQTYDKMLALVRRELHVEDPIGSESDK